MAEVPSIERLRITDAAAFLGVSRQRVQQLLHADRLPEPDAGRKVAAALAAVLVIGLGGTGRRSSVRG